MFFMFLTCMLNFVQIGCELLFDSQIYFLCVRLQKIENLTFD